MNEQKMIDTVDVQELIETLESGLLITKMTKTDLVHLVKDDAQKILDILYSVQKKEKQNDSDQNDE